MTTTSKEVTGKRVREQTSCPATECTSSDAFTIWEHDDGRVDGYCFSCGYYTRQPDKDLDSEIPTGVNGTGTQASVSHKLNNSSGVSSPVFSGAPQKLKSIEDGTRHPVREIRDRLISHATCERFGVKIGVSTQDGETPIYHLYPYYKHGKLSAYKQRFTHDKSFLSCGDMKDVDLFGANLLPSKGKKVWITEGEIDALSVYQVLKETSTLPDWEPAVVSLPHGSSSAVKAISNSIDFLSGYEEVILVFDNDPPGIEARDKVCKLLAGKVYTLSLPFKDPNEMLMAGKANELKWSLLTKAKKYQPDGIVNAKDLWDRYKDAGKVECIPYPPFMPILNDKTYGVRPGSIITVTAGSGSGKTQFLRELMYYYVTEHNQKTAGIFLEEDISETMAGLVALDLNKRITLPDVQVSQDSEKESFQRLFGSGLVSLYDYFGGMDDDNLLAKLRYFAATGHRFIFLDHLSIVVSEYAAQGGERERIDTLMTKLAKFVKEFNVVLFLVVHLRKTSETTSFELGAQPSLDDMRGSGTLKQLSWDVIGLSRNQQHSDNYCANTTEVSVLKCRFTGRTGVSDYLHFNENTGRLYCVEKPSNYRKKSKQVSLSEEY